MFFTAKIPRDVNINFFVFYCIFMYYSNMIHFIYDYWENVSSIFGGKLRVDENCEENVKVKDDTCSELLMKHIPYLRKLCLAWKIINFFDMS